MVHSSWPSYCDQEEILNRSSEDLYHLAHQFLPDLKKGLQAELFDPAWKLKSTVGKTFIYEKKESLAGLYSLVGITDMKASITEVLDVLSAQSSTKFNSSMSSLFRTHYINGSVLHNARPETNSSDDDGLLSIKKASFDQAYPIIGKKEDIMFLDYVKRDLEEKTAIRLIKSIDNDEAPSFFRGRALDRMHGVLSGYFISQSEVKGRVRVSFYLSQYYSCPYRVNKDTLSMHRKKQLNKIASSLRMLNDVVMQRRLGRQALIKQDYRLRNSCSGSVCHQCLNVFGRRRKKFQCKICGFDVCKKCSDTKIAETPALKKISVRLCGRCIRRVHECSYEEVNDQPLDSPLVVEAESVSSREKGSTVRSSRSAIDEFTDSLVELVKKGDKEISRAAVKLLEKMEAVTVMEANPAQNDQQNDTNQTSDLPVPTPILDTKLVDESTLSGNKEDIEKAKIMIPLDKLSCDDCEFFEPDQLRSYPLDFDWDNNYPKPPIPENEEERLNKLLLCEIMDTPNEALYDIACETGAKQLNCPMAAICLIADNRQYLKATVGLGDVREVPRDCSICAYTITNFSPFLIPNCSADLRFCQNPLVVGPMGLRFYLGFPLVTSDKKVLGTFCVMDNKPRASITTKQYAILKKLSETITDFIESRIKYPEGQMEESDLEQTYDEDTSVVGSSVRQDDDKLYRESSNLTDFDLRSESPQDYPVAS